jgi:hypothetical protein
VSVMRTLFGPSHTEIWRQVSAEIGARYEEHGFWQGDKVTAAHGEWTIILDKYYCAASKMHYTRLRATFVNPEAFRFTIYRRGLFSDLAKWFGMQDVEVGYREFDRDFIIKGTNAPRLQALFARKRIRELISKQPRIHLTIGKKRRDRRREDFAESTCELRFHTVGIIKDVARLKLLFELYAEVLNQLCEMGAAYQTRGSKSQGKVGI